MYTYITIIFLKIIIDTFSICALAILGKLSSSLESNACSIQVFFSHVAMLWHDQSTSSLSFASKPLRVRRNRSREGPGPSTACFGASGDSTFAGDYCCTQQLGYNMANKKKLWNKEAEIPSSGKERNIWRHSRDISSDSQLVCWTFVTRIDGCTALLDHLWIPVTTIPLW